jgi:hypothetical protein
MTKVAGEQWHIESGIRGRIMVKDASGETDATAPEMRDLLEVAAG